MAAGGLNDFLRVIFLSELEAVAEGVALANHRIDLHPAEGEREVQVHDLAQGNFNSQQG